MVAVVVLLPVVGWLWMESFGRMGRGVVARCVVAEKVLVLRPWWFVRPGRGPIGRPQCSMGLW